MIETIYVETEMLRHPRAERIIDKYKRARVVECEHYGEVFNRKGQNFRIQKQAPALILAKKQGRKLYEAPRDHAIGAQHNYYFSHLLNCPFDCRYCFLQGKFDSANYVLFVNYEDFWEDIENKLSLHAEPVHIFSGYDCDSLAFEPITGFVEWLLGQLVPSTSYLLELRTKSAQIRQILRFSPNKSCLVAYSIAPQAIIDHFEHGTSSLIERLTALAQLQTLGWPIGLRVDPLIEFEGCEQVYHEFFKLIEQRINLPKVHSITLGTMRFPTSYLKKIRGLYPTEPLFASVNTLGAGTAGYPDEVVNGLLGNAKRFFLRHLDPARIFVQNSEDKESEP